MLCTNFLLVSSNCQTNKEAMKRVIFSKENATLPWLLVISCKQQPDLLRIYLNFPISIYLNLIIFNRFGFLVHSLRVTT